MRECPPSDKGVGCEHGTWDNAYSISAIFCETEAQRASSGAVPGRALADNIFTVTFFQSTPTLVVPTTFAP
jgi:hypothetical protein